ncbi:MAG: DUF2147 domain-containing protein, partial [Deltaproteobacteria bacterium]|nr:DUF2147 domain-containing protein [Deltaproteobacteria bacterium]
MHAILVTLALLLPVTALAGVEGYWKTVNEDTQRPQSVVLVTTEEGVATGRIVQVFCEPTDKPDPICDLCEGPEKDQTIVGMMILSNLKSDGSQWSGGTVLDPGNGKRYRAYIEEEEGGDRLKVRGYIGIALLGRTQYWYRVEKPDPNIRTYLLNGPGELMP